MGKEIIIALTIIILLIIAGINIAQNVEFEIDKRNCKVAQRTTNIQCFDSLAEKSESTVSTERGGKGK